MAPLGSEPIRFDAAGTIRSQDLDLDAVKVIRRLQQHGFVAYLVGGCVRDLLLGRVPKDFDIATEARPRQVKRLFRQSRIIGRRFRLVHIAFDGKVLDVSTFRAQVEQHPGNSDPMIRQDNIFGTAAEDARRRDFSINGLFYDVAREEVIDYVGGLRDLDRKVIETIGDPWVRFREDPVRMLRAIKFAGRLRFHLADDVYQAIVDCGPDIRKAAAPRLQEEILRILDRGGALASMRLMYKSGILGWLLPELALALERVPSEGRTPYLWGLLGLADRLALGGNPISPVVMLACVFSPLVEDLVLTDPGADPRPVGELALRLDSELRPIAQRLHMSRRDTYWLKQIFLAQPRFVLPFEARRRQASRSRFLQRDIFDDAFQFFGLYSGVSGRFADQLERWRSVMQGARSGREPARARSR